MLISRNWLQSYFEKELPSAEEIADTLMLHSFEIEGVESLDNDSVIDIDVLPNRAHDCLSYAGIAQEYSLLSGYPLLKNRYPEHDVVPVTETIEVTLDNPDQCYRYIAQIMKNIAVTDSPEWLQDRMKSIGQRSINNIVDATNYIMFDTGNPMHVFDADKISGAIIIRNAYDGETFTTLSGEDLDLKESDLVIADNLGILALAGVKGGTRAEVDANTTNVVLEVANFNPTTTRSTARRVKILTDASKRFENEISSEIAMQTIEFATRLIYQLAGNRHTEIGVRNDVYPNPETQRTVVVALVHIQSLLGIEISEKQVSDILSRFDFNYQYENMNYHIVIPKERLDLTIAEDIIEEIGRVYGYHNIPTKNLDNYAFTPRIHPLVYAEQELRNFFIQKGFSEVMTYSFAKKGDVEVSNPIASDKRALRKNLHKKVLESLESNLHNTDYFGTDRVMIFEIGRVYTKQGEQTSCCVAIANKGKSANKKYGTERVQLEMLQDDIVSMLGVEVELIQNSLVFTLNSSIEKDISLDTYSMLLEDVSYGDSDIFHPVSVYPYTKRDISFWVSDGQSESQLREIIVNTKTQYLKKIFLFDRFEKEERFSYAFSLIFQSNDRTLTDEDVDTDMQSITQSLEEIGFEMR